MVYQLMQTIQWLQQRVDVLEMETQNLKNRIEEIKPIHIDSIVYKIQELQIKDLKGTLNIGITAQADEKTLDKFMSDLEINNEADLTFDNDEDENITG